jgi:MFS family permease
MVGYVVVILVPTWWAVFAGSILFISWTAISLPAVMSLVSRTVPKDKRTMGVTVHSFVRRIPMALGPVLGGLLIGALGRVDGVRAAFGAALLLALAAMICVHLLMEDGGERKRPSGSLLRSLRLISPPLRGLLVSDILIRFAEQIPYAFVVLWVVDVNGQSALRFGILTAVEMATAMLVYIPVAYLADRSTKKPFVLITFGFFTLFPLVLLGSRSFPLLVLAFVIRGLKEFGEPTRKALIMDLAPADRKGAMFGLYYLVRDTVVSFAALGGAGLWAIQPQLNLLVAFGFGVIGTVWFALRGRDAATSARPSVPPR